MRTTPYRPLLAERWRKTSPNLVNERVRLTERSGDYDANFLIAAAAPWVIGSPCPTHRISAFPKSVSWCTDRKLRSLSRVRPGHPAANSGHVAITSPANTARRSGHQNDRLPGVCPGVST